MKKNIKALPKAIWNILGVSAIVAMLPYNVLAQGDSAANNVMEEIYVTGSSIKRSDLDGALPVQVINIEAIERSGVSSVTELMAKLPAMQGFTTQADSVGGDGGGIATANLRDLGSQYTLVLLNGRRLAPADSSSQVDLSNIPLSAVERVEVLTDGASALYGSDAIAGVVNFILKSSVEGTTVSARFDRPSEDGGESSNFDITTGFGDFEEDRFNIVLSFSHDEQEQLASVQRDFAKSGIIEFNAPGYNQRALFFNGSGNSIPGNARVRYLDGAGELQTRTFSPYKLNNNGACPTQTSPINDECWFDYTSTIEILPEYERNSFFGQANVRITDNLTGFITTAVSSNEMTTRIAPYPTGYARLPNTSSLVVNEILPLLTAEQLAGLQTVDGRWRALPAGNRTTEWNTDTVHIVTGLDGSTDIIDYSGAFTYSVSETEQNYPTGWLLLTPFVNALGSGAFNIFAPATDFSDADRAALEPTVYHGPWDNTKVTMTGFDAKASMAVFELSGGEAKAAVGMDIRRTQYERTVAPANANEELLFLSKDTPYDLERDQYGIFSELWMPILDNLETTVSVRYDEIGAVSDSLNGGDINDRESDVTYKISTRWNITDALSLRASYGTGFKAPSMREIGEPRSEFGVTSGSFACPFAAADPLASLCLTGESQYSIFREGSAKLTPETSTQYTYGIVYAPSNEFSITVDYWNIEMEDLVERLTEDQIFSNPVLYRDLFTSKLNLATNENELAIIQAAVNVGKSENSGIDYNIQSRHDMGFGELSLGWTGTYFIESNSSLTGSSLGRFGNDDRVTFRNITQFNVGLDHGSFSHSVTLNYRSGYTDQQQEVTLLNNDGSFGNDVDIQLRVSSYSTVDYQSQYSMLDEDLTISVGLNNAFDRQPPLTLRTSGAGHQIGWDPRYVDAYGRTLYMKASYKF